MGTKVGTQKAQDDLLRQNRMLERRIKALEMALKAERYAITQIVALSSRVKNAGEEVAEKFDERPPTPSSTSPLDNGLHFYSPNLISVDTDITPLLTDPDRQRSRKLLETCLQEINYLMTPQTIPASDQHPTVPLAEWHSPQPRHPPQHQQQLQQIPVLHLQWQPKIPPSTFPQPQPQPAHNTDTKEVSYVTVESESFRAPEDEELPRKLPKKISLPTPPPEPPTKKSPPPDDNWDFPTEPKISTILERPQNAQLRQSAKQLFEKKSTGPRVFNHIHTLRSHLAPVRAMIPANSAATHPQETCFVTAGDDSLVKFWRVDRNASPLTAKKRGNVDVVPQITFRGHAGMVTCLAESAGTIWSGGTDGGIRGWKVPSSTRDSYGSSGTRGPSNPPAFDHTEGVLT